MREVVLQIPTLDAEQNIDIEVRINGRTRALHYRVEIVNWDDYPTEKRDRIEVIRRVVRDHGRDWQLVQIGMPSDEGIPIMFRHKQGSEPA